MCTGLGNDGEAEGAAPGSLCMHWVSTGGQLPWGEQKEGMGGDSQSGCLHTYPHLPVHDYLPCLQIHVPDMHIHLRDFYALLNAHTFFKCYYSMYYSYLGHCPKAFEGQGQN